MFPTPDHIKADAPLKNFSGLTRREQSAIIECGKKQRHVDRVNSENINEILGILNESLNAQQFED